MSQPTHSWANSETLTTLSLIRTQRRIACDLDRQAKQFLALNKEYAGKFPNGKDAFMPTVKRCIQDARDTRNRARGWLRLLRNRKAFWLSQQHQEPERISA